MFYRPRNLYTLKYLLEKSEKGGYAVGSFSPRCSQVVKPIFRAGERTQSPIIVQICQPELNMYKMTMAQFAQEFSDLFTKE